MSYEFIADILTRERPHLWGQAAPSGRVGWV